MTSSPVTPLAAAHASFNLSPLGGGHGRALLERRFTYGEDRLAWFGCHDLSDGDRSGYHSPSVSCSPTP